MSVQLLAYSPTEAEAFAAIPELDATIGSVAQMIMDLDDNNSNVEVLFALNDEDDPNYFTLSFSGSLLSLVFTPDNIEVTEFDPVAEDEETIKVFPRDNINQATAWLINRLRG